jgi:hypothetical protein
MSLSLRIQDLHPAADEPTHHQLVDVLLKGVARGAAPPVGVVVRSSVVHLVDMRGAQQAKVPAGRLLAGLTHARFDESLDQPEAVGLLGTFRVRRHRDDPGALVVQTFLEWSDCRWWQWRALLDAEGGILEGSEAELSAVQGDPLPRGLGRWWSTARRHNLSLHLRRQAPTPPVSTSQMVH